MGTLLHKLSYKKAQLLLTNPRDAKACRKLLKIDVKTSCKQANDLFEVMVFGFLKYRNLAIMQRVINNVDRVRGLYALYRIKCKNLSVYNTV